MTMKETLTLLIHRNLKTWYADSLNSFAYFQYNFLHFDCSTMEIVDNYTLDLHITNSERQLPNKCPPLKWLQRGHTLKFWPALFVSVPQRKGSVSPCPMNLHVSHYVATPTPDLNPIEHLVERPGDDSTQTLNLRGFVSQNGLNCPDPGVRRL